MIFVTKFEGIETGEGITNAYLSFAAGGEAVPPRIERNDDVALTAIRGLGDCGPYLCDAMLADAAARAGFTVSAVPADLVEPITALALLSTWALRVSRWTNHETIMKFAEAAAAFDGAQPWEHRTSDEPLMIEFDGAVTGTFEASVMGSARACSARPAGRSLSTHAEGTKQRPRR